MTFDSVTMEKALRNALTAYPATYVTAPCIVQQNLATLPHYEHRMSGWYDAKSATIHILPPSFWDYLFAGAYCRNFLHEVGHHIYYTHLGETQRAAWEKAWRALKTDLPSDYARTDASEGWAECCLYRWCPRGWWMLWLPRTSDALVKAMDSLLAEVA